MTSLTRWEAVRSRKQAHSGGKQDRTKPVPSTTGSGQHGGRGPRGPNAPFSGALIIYLLGLVEVPHHHLEEAVPRREVVLVATGRGHFSMCPPS